jgi:hypothetical protein
MKKMILALSMLLSNALAFGSIETNTYLKDEGIVTNAENIHIPLTDEDLEKKWQFAFADSTKDGSFVIEFVPKGEDVDNWSELIQIQYFPLTKDMDGKINAEIFSNHFLGAIKTHFPDSETKMLKSEKDRVLLEWKIRVKTDKEDPQDEIALIMSTKTGLYRVAFTKKTANLDESIKEGWIAILNATKIEKS